jgi:hypothetical protein
VRKAQRASLLHPKEVRPATVGQDDGCRGDPEEDRHRHDSRRQPTHQAGLVVAVAAFIAAAWAATFIAARATFIAAAWAATFVAAWATFVAAAFFTLVAVAFVIATATLAVIARRFVLIEAGATAGVPPHA